MKKSLLILFAVIALAKISFGQNVGIGTNTPAAKLTINGNLALLSDTVKVNCSILPGNEKLLINNIAKPMSVFHIINDGCTSFFPPTLVGLTGGTDGKIVTIITHLNSTLVQHLQSTSFLPTAADSLNMIELYEPNSNGNINQPSSFSFNAGGSVTLIYDGRRNRWKLLSYNGDVKSETLGWYKGSNVNDIYNPNAGNVGIGTGSPTEKMDIRGNINVQGNIKVNQVVGQRNQVLGTDEAGNTSWMNTCSFPNFQGYSVNLFSSIQTFTVPPGVNRILIEAWAPGGGGALGGGGGAGGYVTAIIKCAPASVITITRTSDGGSGSSTINGYGGNGGSVNVSGTGFTIISEGGKGAGPSSGGAGGGAFSGVSPADSAVCFFKIEGQSGTSSTETFQQRSATQFTGIITGGNGGNAYNNLTRAGTGGTYIYDVSNNNAIKKYDVSATSYSSGGGGGPEGGFWGGGGGNCYVIVRW